MSRSGKVAGVCTTLFMAITLTGAIANAKILMDASVKNGTSFNRPEETYRPERNGGSEEHGHKGGRKVATPEPSSFVLVVAGGLALGFAAVAFRRRHGSGSVKPENL
jgi:hypothetical protein